MRQPFEKKVNCANDVVCVTEKFQFHGLLTREVTRLRQYCD